MKRTCKIVNDLPISMMNLKEIKKIAYQNGKGTSIPTLEEFIMKANSIDPNYKLMIEGKEFSKPQLFAKKVGEIFEKYQLYERAVFGSFNPISLYYMRKYNPKIVTLLLVERFMVSGWMGTEIQCQPRFIYDLHFFIKLFITFTAFIWDWIIFISCLTWLPHFLGVGVMGIDIDIIKNGSFDIKKWKDAGYVVNIWVVNDKKDKMKFESIGDVAITTDLLFL
jgi:glycerophosphoinositol glycerophosphodiesterase